MTGALQIFWTTARARLFLITPTLTAAWLVLVPVQSIAEQPAGKIAVGERVVLRGGDSALQLDGREVARSRRENHIYRIEAVSGASLKLNAEEDCLAGAVTASGVVPVSQAIDFFTRRIQAHPSFRAGSQRSKISISRDS
jgi:hypothetical protein